MNDISTSKDYAQLLAELKTAIQDSRLKVARAASRELVLLYWRIGKSIVERQDKQGWGKSVVEQLAKDLANSTAGKRGFSAQNLWYMRQFYNEYKDLENLQQLVGEVPWGQNLTIMSKVKNPDERAYYLKATASMGWSRNVLIHQIQSNAYDRHCSDSKQNNFETALPKHLAEQADEAMKDIYMLDMLGAGQPMLERDLENAMVDQIQRVMLELGFGFAFIGNQYRIKAHDNEYFIDLLFSNRRLNCLVAIELKLGKFKPEYAGKMNFYLNLLDDFVREPNENPSIGIILCSERDRFEVEYALRGIDKPVGVADYVLTQELPEPLRGKLPDAKTLQAELTAQLKLNLPPKNHNSNAE